MIYESYIPNTPYVKSKTFKEIKSLERILDNSPKLTSTDQKVAKKFVRDLNLHWSKRGYVSNTKERMRNSLSPKPSIDTVKRSYKKLVSLGILVPLWFEKGGNLATRYVLSTKNIYDLDAKRCVNSEKGKLRKIDRISKEFVNDNIIQTQHKIYGYSEEFIDSIHDFLEFLTGAKSTTYLYERVPVSTMKRISYPLRIDGLISHYEYISYAGSLISGKEVSMKDVYKVEMIENKHKQSLRKDNKKTFCERLAEFNESISQPMPVEYEGGFAEIRS